MLQFQFSFYSFNSMSPIEVFANNVWKRMPDQLTFMGLKSSDEIIWIKSLRSEKIISCNQVWVNLLTGSSISFRHLSYSYVQQWDETYNCDVRTHRFEVRKKGGWIDIRRNWNSHLDGKMGVDLVHRTSQHDLKSLADRHCW